MSLSLIYFDSDMREDEFTIIIPTSIKEKLIYVFKTLGKYKNYTPKLIINNVNQNNIEVNNLDSYSLEKEINYLIGSIDEDDFTEETPVLKEYLIEIATVCNIDYIEWEYENLLTNV